MTFHYPDNLAATATIFKWSRRDFFIICGMVIISIIVFAFTFSVVPGVATLVYSIAKMRLNDSLSIYDYMSLLFNYVFTQQFFKWRL